MPLHPTASECNFVDSMSMFFHTILPEGILDEDRIVDSDDYEALADVFQDDTNDLFIIYALGEAHGTNQALRSCAVSVLTRRDPGNRRGLEMIDRIRAYILPGLSIPFRNYTTGDGEIVTQMTIMDQAVGPWIDEEDDFRSKTIAFALGYAQILKAE